MAGEKETPRVLVLEDQQKVRRMLGDFLRTRGVELILCSEIEAAEALIHKFRFDVVVCDMEVSDLGGLEGMRLVRHVASHFPDSAIIIYSAHVDQKVVERGRVLGATHVFKKPDDLKRLRAAVKKVAPGSDAPEAEAAGMCEVETLEEYLDSGMIRAVVHPIVKISPQEPPFELFGVESLARGPKESMLSQPEILFGYAALKEKLFETDILCLTSAFREASSLPGNVALFVNLQPRSLSHPDLPERLVKLARTNGFEEARVVLEMTEQNTILNSAAFEAALKGLRERGFKVALDDYGEGVSSLRLMDYLRPEFVKISGHFCRHIASDPFRRDIIKSTADMARRLGIPTVMENVETQEEMEVLGDLGVDYVQGYFVMRPAPAEEVAASGRVKLPSLSG